MKWYYTNPACKSKQTYQAPRYKPSDWWLMEDLQQEIKKITGIKISKHIIGKIAKELNLIRKTSYGYKEYHKDILKIIGGLKNE